jgi:hypothetical protein
MDIDRIWEGFGEQADVRPSMGFVGDHDNVTCESFDAALECELLINHQFYNCSEAALRCSTLSKAATIRKATYFDRRHFSVKFAYGVKPLMSNQKLPANAGFQFGAKSE